VEFGQIPATEPGQEQLTYRFSSPVDAGFDLFQARLQTTFGLSSTFHRPLLIIHP